MNNYAEQDSSPKQNIPTDTQLDIHFSTENLPIAPEQRATCNSIGNNVSTCDFKDQIMRLNAEIEALKSFFEQVFVAKKSLEEKHQSVGDSNYVGSLKDKIKYLRAENQMKTAITKTILEKEKSSVQCSYSIVAPVRESSSRNLKFNSISKIDFIEVLSNAVQVTKENSRDKLPTINSENYRQRGPFYLRY